MGRNFSEKWLEVVFQEIQDADPEIRFEATRAIGSLATNEPSVAARPGEDEDPEVARPRLSRSVKLAVQLPSERCGVLIRSAIEVISDAAQRSVHRRRHREWTRYDSHR